MEKFAWTPKLSRNLDLEGTLSILKENFMFRKERRNEGRREGGKEGRKKEGEMKSLSEVEHSKFIQLITEHTGSRNTVR